MRTPAAILMILLWLLPLAQAQESDVARLNCQILRAGGGACDGDALARLQRENEVLRQRLAMMEARTAAPTAERLDRALRFLAAETRKVLPAVWPRRP